MDKVIIIIIVTTVEIIVRIIIQNFVVVYMNKGLNDTVFHYVLFCEILHL